MPLIQEALAQEMNSITDEVMVGVYAFGERRVEWMSYTETEIEDARSPLEDLLTSLRL